MYTKEQWYGGSRNLTANTTLSMGGPRFNRDDTDSGAVHTLPDLTNHILNPRDYGRCRFVFVRTNPGNSVIQDASATEIIGLYQDRGVIISLYDNNGTPAWKAIARLLT
jgi:hypothetical protein